MATDVKTMKTVAYFIFLGSKITVDGDCSHEIKTVAPCKESYEKPPRQQIKKQRCYFTDKGQSSHSYCFSIGHVWMRELDSRKLSTKELMLSNCGTGKDS